MFVSRLTGDPHTVGRVPRKEAIRQAKAANALIDGELAKRDLAAKLLLASGPQFTAWLEKYEGLLRRRELSPHTMRQHTWKLESLKKRFTGQSMAELETPMAWADFIDEMVEDGRAGAAVNWQSFIKDIWREAVCQGWAKTNPALNLRRISYKVKQARLTFDGFMLMYEQALREKDTWLARAMELGMLTSQRREDLAEYQFKHRKDALCWVEDGALFVFQQKTKKKLAIHTGIRLNSFGMSLAESIGKCRDNIVTNWMIHHVRHFGGAEKVNPGDRVPKSRITHRFAELRARVAEKHGPFWDEGKEPPPFQEIRSLSIREWTKQEGGEFAQCIAGHQDAATTAIYQDVRGSEWMRVG